MTNYSIFLDESYDDAADIYVIGGVIVETDRIADLSAAVSKVSQDLVHDKHAELKYTDDPQVRALLKKYGKTQGDVREAMAAIPAAVDATLVASIIVDPTVDAKAGSLKPLSWALLRSITHFTNFLQDVGAPTEPGSHEVMADRFPNKQHKTVFHEAYRESYDRVPHGRSPKAAGLRDFIAEGDATHCLPLRLADFFAGTVRSWAQAERKYDADPGPATGKDTARTRHSLSRYLPHVRGKRYSPDRKSGYGLAIWPEERRAQLDLWIAHTRGQRAGEMYQAPGIELISKPEGGTILRIEAGSARSWQ